MSELNSCKLVLLGESGVGKTCIISRYVKNVFDDRSETTSGASYASKTIQLGDNQGSIRLDIWDTAGQEKYRSLTKFFYKDAAIAILVYDITRRDSYTEIKEYWYDQLRTCGEKNIVIGVAGNKSDLFDKENVSESEAKEWANSIGAIFQLTSAFQNNGIEELFYNVSKKFMDPDFQVNLPVNEGDTGVKKLSTKTSKKKKKFC